MKRRTSRGRIAIGVTLTALCAAVVAPLARGADVAGPQGSVFSTDNESGSARTISVAGSPVVADSNPFFQDLGANGRRWPSGADRDRAGVDPGHGPGQDPL